MTDKIPEAIVPAPRAHPPVRPKPRKRKREKVPKTPRDAQTPSGPQVSDFLRPPTSEAGDIIDALLAAGDHSKPLISGTDDMKKVRIPGNKGRVTRAPKQPKAKPNKPAAGGSFGQFEAAMTVENMPKRDRPPPSFRSNR